jgi:hypothetical protein
MVEVVDEMASRTMEGELEQRKKEGRDETGTERKREAK